MASPAGEHLLKLLADDAAICDACGLHETRTHSVFSRGSPQARLMFVGEAPGEQEDLSGKPFVGPAGQLLDRMIAAMGLSAEQVYICNAVKCRPPGNRKPEPLEIHACRGFLREQITVIKPKIIVALGKSASLSLSDGVPLELLFPQGWAGKWREYMGIPLLTTYHPSYLLRTPSAKKIVGKHLFTVLERLKQ